MEGKAIVPASWCLFCGSSRCVMWCSSGKSLMKTILISTTVYVQYMLLLQCCCQWYSEKKSFVFNVVKSYSACCQRKCYGWGALANILLFNFTSHLLPCFPRDDSWTVWSEGWGRREIMVVLPSLALYANNELKWRSQGQLGCVDKCTSSCSGTVGPR